MPVNKRDKQIFARIRFWLPVLLCMGIIFYSSSIPGSNIPSLFSYQDIVFHFLIYLMLSFFFCRAFKNTYSNLTQVKVILLGIAFGIIYGLTDEFHQSFVPYRSVSGLDLFIDGVGSFAGSLLNR